MHNKLALSLLALLALSGAALAAGQPPNPNPASAAQAVRWADGVVVRVNEQRGSLTLRHGDIAGVMPAMTMTYPVQDADALRSLHSGDRVRFVMQQRQDQYLVTQVELAR